jgi:hypothetical protein
MKLIINIQNRKNLIGIKIRRNFKLNQEKLGNRSKMFKYKISLIFHTTSY